MARPGISGLAAEAQFACVWEVMARKPGNVHPSAQFHDIEASSFLTSAAILGEVFATFGPVVGIDPSAPVGRRVYEAVRATQRWIPSNTNLGIALALSPLVQASYAGYTDTYRESVARVLSQLSVRDAKWAFDAICLANPGGLGDAPEQDVRSEPTVTLLEAMKLAADRDLIARQYANNYADVFDLGVPAFTDAFAKYGNVEAAVIACQLAWMAAFPDSLIARKRGLTVAEDVQRRVQHVLSVGGLDTPEGRRAGIELDAYLRSDGNKLNPGTTADLVAACLFVALRENKVKPSAPFRWNVPDWL
jgi:triphosphoribosyl-dephospho-CoA synthase